MTSCQTTSDHVRSP